MRQAGLLVALLAALAGCGADGAPARPGETRPVEMPPPGLSITGSSEIGVVSR